MFRPRRVTVANGKYVKVGIPVDRGTPLGNPFKLHREDMRDQVCDSYERWLDRRIEEKDAAVCDALNHIYRKAKRGNVILLCHCAPLRCHAEYIALRVNDALKDRMQKGLVISDERLAELEEEAQMFVAEDGGYSAPDYDDQVEARFEKLCAAEEAKLKSISGNAP